MLKTSGAEVRIVIRGVVPIHVRLAVVPVAVRHVAIAIARTSLPRFIRIIVSRNVGLLHLRVSSGIAGVVLSKASSFW